MATTEYGKKLKNPKWQKKRLKILERDNFACVYCGDTETELHVNHKSYNGEPWEAPDKDLETVCKHCHQLIHLNNAKELSKKLMIKKQILPFDDINASVLYVIINKAFHIYLIDHSNDDVLEMNGIINKEMLDFIKTINL
jgi:hypothetical protein